MGESNRTCIDGEIFIEYDFDTGEWLDSNSTCDDGCDCDTGACCCDEECLNDVGYDECTGNNCYYLGNGTICEEEGGGLHVPEGNTEPVVCPQFGACCVNKEECIHGLTEEECNKLEGIFQGINTIQCENCGDIGYCCVPLGTSSDVPLAEFGFCLGNRSGNVSYVSGCPHDDNLVGCFPPDGCCKTGVSASYGVCTDGDYNDFVGITENQCIQIGGEWYGADADSDGEQECKDSGCHDDPFECVCSYAYCANPEPDQVCGYTDIVQNCVVIELPSTELGDRFQSCQEVCRSFCVESGGDLENDCFVSQYGWQGVSSGVCESVSPFCPYCGVPLECDDVSADIPLNACLIDACDNWCCCHFECDDGDVGLYSCLPLPCNNESATDCANFSGNWVEADCPDDLCPCS